MVGGFGVRQLVLVRRVSVERDAVPAAVLDEVPPTEVCHVEAAIDTTPAIAWSVITDHELYGRLAPNLSRVSPTAADGPGLTRTCANRGGDEWSETCTVWDEGHQYDIAVDTSNYPYPLVEMRGSWSTGATVPVVVSMDFRYRPRPGIRGRLFAAAMQAAFPMVLGRIIRGWRRAASARVAARLSGVATRVSGDDSMSRHHGALRVRVLRRGAVPSCGGSERNARPLAKRATAGCEWFCLPRVEEFVDPSLVELDDEVAVAVITGCEEVAVEAEAGEAHHRGAGHSRLVEQRCRQLPESILPGSAHTVVHASPTSRR